MLNLSKIGNRYGDSVFNWARKFYNPKPKIELLPVDFESPWWKMFFKKPVAFGVMIASKIVQSTFEAVTPLLIGYIIASGEYRNLIAYVLVLAVLKIANRIIFDNYHAAYASVQGSIGLAGFQFFLTTDPVFYSTKSTGTIQSKIKAGEANFSNMIHVFIHSVFDSFVSFTVVIITLLSFSWQIGLISLTSFILIASMSFYGNVFITKIFTKIFIKRRDKYSALSIENLYQNSLIRSTFTTAEQSQKTGTAIVDYLEVRTLMQQTRGLVGLIVRFLFMISIALIGLSIMNQIDSGQLDVTVGIALLLTYITGSGKVHKVGQDINSFIEGVVNLNDLWEYINNFGQQSFPVLEDESKKHVQ